MKTSESIIDEPIHGTCAWCGENDRLTDTIYGHHRICGSCMADYEYEGEEAEEMELAWGTTTQEMRKQAKRVVSTAMGLSEEPENLNDPGALGRAMLKLIPLDTYHFEINRTHGSKNGFKLRVWLKKEGEIT